ncbi:ethylene-responsive transcription factor ERF020-like [Humulus lupulus]|uniref:ethylene-responsive transcription factor ERF020-like n=1 Tax=Humulus lupulus TaxID=3486 RepID=UPI002B409A4D|nr:ethylene-responsive transcription factor ERF020-like [Humulus lupulus]XP_062097550.1 ethylene-responsive transcription factor ERF020-like [Humulus lupulus]
MSYDSEESRPNSAPATKYKGIRRRKWGKWVSEIRVPGTQSRLWLGSYATAEAAAVAHDVAFYCLRRPLTSEGLNFPMMLPAAGLPGNMSPRSVQKAASDAGMAIDAQVQLPSSAGNSPGTEQKVTSGVQNGAFCSTDQTLLWGDVGASSGTWEGCEVELGPDAEALSISIEDYL